MTLSIQRAKWWTRRHEPLHPHPLGKGENNGKQWIRYALTFSDGRKTSTFSDEIADCADHAHKNNLPVIVTMEPSKKNPKYTDLVELSLDGGE